MSVSFPSEPERTLDYYRALFEQASDALLVVALGKDGELLRIVDGNQRCLECLGFARGELLDASPGSVLGRQLAQLFEPGVEPRVRTLTLESKTGERILGEARTERLTLDGRALALVSFRAATPAARSEREEEQVRHAQKLEAIGRLAGGIAHDFNNLLTVVLQYSSLVLEELRPEDPMYVDVAEIEKAGKRAAALTRQLLAFSRRSPVEPVLIDLDGLVRELERMLGRILGEDIVLSAELASSPWCVEADKSHLEQALANLVVHARDAMPRGGRLTLRTRQLDTSASLPGGLGTGEYVLLSVIDDGVGMTSDVQSHVFEPFFNRRDGKGTGLELATVYGIVKQAGGEVHVESAPERGTAFHLYLPRSTKTAVEPRAHTRPMRRLASGATILMVEDEDAVRGIARRALERDGHIVLEARNGGEALLIAERATTKIDLVVTDVVMPGVSGPALVERLRGMRPGLEAVFMSGHPEEVLDDHGLVQTQSLLVRKPFTRETLGSAVQEALARRALPSAKPAPTAGG